MTYFDVKENIDKWMYGVFNIFSSFLFVFKRKVKRDIKLNIKYKNIHANERCFIVGTGPSLNKLTKEQLAMLKNETIFAVNSFYKSAIVDEIVPTYYSLFDNLYWGAEKHFFSDIIKKYDQQEPRFITDIRAKSIINKLNPKKSPLYLYTKKYPINKIDNDLSKNTYIGINVVNISILTAMYMGFKEIYLLGCDYNSFASNKDQHCYVDIEEQKYNTENLAFYLKFYSLITQNHYLIAKLAAERGVSIVNMTPDSLLDAYPRKDLSSLEKQ